MKKRVREAYELIGENYDKRYTQLPDDLYKYEEALFWENIDLSDGDKILDLGTGTGRFATKVVGTKIVFIGVDFSKTMVKIAKKKYSQVKNVEFIVADAENMPFQPLSFDKVVSIGMFEYIGKPQRILSEIQYVLKEKGKICVNVWNKFGILRLPLVRISEFYRGTTSFERTSFTSNQFRLHLESSGFNKIKTHGYFFVPPYLLRKNSLKRVFRSNVIAKLDQMVLLRKVASSLLFSASKCSRVNKMC